MSIQKSDVFDIAKAFYDIENARKRLELVLDGKIALSAKQKLSAYAKRLQWIITDMMTTLPKESAEIMRQQVCSWETISFESVFDEMILMSEQQRADFELFAQAYRKGEIVYLDKEAA